MCACARSPSRLYTRGSRALVCRSAHARARDQTGVRRVARAVVHARSADRTERRLIAPKRRRRPPRRTRQQIRQTSKNGCLTQAAAPQRLDRSAQVRVATTTRRTHLWVGSRAAGSQAAAQWTRRRVHCCAECRSRQKSTSSIYKGLIVGRAPVIDVLRGAEVGSMIDTWPSARARHSTRIRVE